MSTVFDAILKYGHDEDFDPLAGEDFLPTDAPPGTAEKIDILRKRVELGQPLWHDEDRVDYSGLVATVRPQEPQHSSPSIRMISAPPVARKKLSQ